MSAGLWSVESAKGLNSQDGYAQGFWQMLDGSSFEASARAPCSAIMGVPKSTGKNRIPVGTDSRERQRAEGCGAGNF
jgi:hypothetical protein